MDHYINFISIALVLLSCYNSTYKITTMFEINATFNGFLGEAKGDSGEENSEADSGKVGWGVCCELLEEREEHKHTGITQFVMVFESPTGMIHIM